MGCSPFARSSDAYRPYTPILETAPNPNPYRFTILGYEQYGRYLLAEIKYLDCTTFDGRKLIIFKDLTPLFLELETYIDPHFFEDGNIVARFIPNKEGVKLARALLQSLVD